MDNSTKKKIKKVVGVSTRLIWHFGKSYLIGAGIGSICWPWILKSATKKQLIVRSVISGIAFGGTTYGIGKYDSDLATNDILEYIDKCDEEQ